MKKYVLIGFLLAIFQSCTPYIYYPNAPNIPLPANKHELKAGGGISTAGYCIDASYAISNHILILGNSVGTDLKREYFGETGIGYYKSFEKRYRLEVIGGFGIGKVSGGQYEPEFSIFKDEPPNSYYYQFNNDYSRFMLQTDFGYFREHFGIGLSAKIYNIYMRNTLYEEETVDFVFGNVNPKFTSIPSQSLFFEPALVVNTGSKHLKVQLCLGGSIPFGPQAQFWNTSNLNYEAFSSLGIFIDLFQK